jgi:hypothetical protein
VQEYIFWSETAEPILRCVQGHWPGTDSNHFPTTVSSKFSSQFWPKVNVTLLIHGLTGWDILSHNNSFNVKENDEHCLDFWILTSLLSLVLVIEPICNAMTDVWFQGHAETADDHTGYKVCVTLNFSKMSAQISFLRPNSLAPS